MTLESTFASSGEGGVTTLRPDSSPTRGQAQEICSPVCPETQSRPQRHFLLIAGNSYLFGTEKYIRYIQRDSEQQWKQTTATRSKKDESQNHNKLSDESKLSMNDAQWLYSFKVQTQEKWNNISFMDTNIVNNYKTNGMTRGRGRVWWRETCWDREAPAGSGFRHAGDGLILTRGVGCTGVEPPPSHPRAINVHLGFQGFAAHEVSVAATHDPAVAAGMLSQTVCKWVRVSVFQ